MAQLLSTNVSGTLAVTQNTTVSGNLIVSGFNVLNEIFQADNLTRVTANSGSTQSAVSLNFVNTSTVTVSVTSGGTGVANIGFTSTATGTGGSGINNFPISANTGATVSANGINFNNTSTIRVNVGSGVTGNANISFDFIGSVTGGSGINNFPVSANSGSTATANGLNFLNSAFILASVSSGTTGNANVTLSLTQNIALDTLTVTNLQNTSSNIFVRNSKLIAPSNIGTPTTTLNQQYGTIHIGDAGGSYQYANIGGFAVNQNANGAIFVFDGLNKSNGSAAKASIYLQVGTDSAAKYGSFDVGNTEVSLSAGHNFDINYNTDNVGANLRIRAGSTGSRINVLFMAANGQSSFNYPVLIQSVNVVPAIASAGNTVRVAANSGSIQSAVGLNFNNTSTIRVNVGAGSTGNANVSFDFIGSVAGGSGINNFPVSANSGATITANGINFVNSSTVTVTVTPGVGGNANISFTATTGGTGTVQSVETGTGLTGGTITVSGTISANIASTTVQGVTKLIDSVTSTDAANAATGAAVKTSFDQATAAYGQANTANTTAVSAYGQANAAFTAANNAANTVQISANSGGTISKVSLNFNNTATIRVNVGSGAGSNANISFDYIGSVTGGGGGGINNFPVSANSRSTVTANGLNFVNTSYATVSVSAGTTGNANVAITPIGLHTQNYASIFSDKGMGEWVHNKDGKFYTIGTVSTGIFANTSGTRFYVVDDGNDTVYQLNLSEAWNISSASVESANLTIGGVETSPQDIFMKNDGKTLYILGDTGNDITWFDLSESWNVRTATANSQTSSTPPTLNLQTTSPRGLFIKEDGTKFWVCSTTTVYQFSMSNPWDMATATYDSISLVTTVETALTGLSIDPTGNYLYLIGSNRDDILEYKMSTPFDVSTASYTGLFYSIQDRQASYNVEGSPSGIFVAYPNNRMYIVGSGAELIIQYEMDNGITLDAKKVFANGKALFADDIFVIGDIVATEGIVSDTITVGSTGQFVVTSGGGTSTSGTLSTSGTFTASGTAADVGTSTSNATYTMGSGATQAGRTKNINIGTNGVAGSFTNINIGTNANTANVVISANTVLISNSVNIGSELIVSGLNILNEIGLADNLTRVSANSGSVKSAVSLNFVNTASIFVSVTDGTTGNANVEFSLNTTALRTIWVPAQSMVSRTTAGAASGTTESTTNRVMAKTFDFDTTTQEFVQFTVRMPKSWNLGTVSFAPYWTAAGTTAGTVAWTLAGMALSDNQAIDTAFGTSQTSSDTWQTADAVHIGPEPGTPITIGNAPVAGDIVFFQVSRDVANDTLDRDAKLLGIALFVTVNARDDT